MKPFKFVDRPFRAIIQKLTGDETPVIKHDSDGKNAVVYSQDKKVFFPVRREYFFENDPDMFVWEILFPAESVPSVYFIEEPIDQRIIWRGKSPKGQLIYWIDNDSSDGLFFSEFDLGGKLFWERVLPCDEELVKIAREIVQE
jgi:hypothetical protein